MKVIYTPGSYCSTCSAVDSCVPFCICPVLVMAGDASTNSLMLLSRLEHFSTICLSLDCEQVVVIGVRYGAETESSSKMGETLDGLHAMPVLGLFGFSLFV